MADDETKVKDERWAARCICGHTWAEHASGECRCHAAFVEPQTARSESSLTAEQRVLLQKFLDSQQVRTVSVKFELALCAALAEIDALKLQLRAARTTIDQMHDVAVSNFDGGEVLKAERDALKAERDSWEARENATAHHLWKMREERDALKAERDALEKARADAISIADKAMVDAETLRVENERLRKDWHEPSCSLAYPINAPPGAARSCHCTWKIAEERNALRALVAELSKKE